MMQLLAFALTLTAYGVALAVMYWAVTTYVTKEPIRQILVWIVVMAAVVVVFTAIFGNLPVPPIVAKVLL